MTVASCSAVALPPLQTRKASPFVTPSTRPSCSYDHPASARTAATEAAKARLGTERMDTDDIALARG